MPKFVHQFTKTLQLLGDFVPQTPYLLPPNPRNLATPLVAITVTAQYSNSLIDLTNDDKVPVSSKFVSVLSTTWCYISAHNVVLC